MLILTRKDGESIKIGENIEIKIIKAAKNNVKIGIEAPREMLVLRSELLDEITQTNERANQKEGSLLTRLFKGFGR